MSRVFRGGRVWLLMVGIVLLISCGGSSENTDPPTNDFPQGEIPSAPMNLTGVVYTDTEIEIFWEPATDDVAVVEYQIFRDDVLVDTRDGLSFYQNFLTPDTTYVYAVLAVDSDAQTGPASTITLRTPATQAVINAGNAMELLEHIVGAANGLPYQDLRSVVESDKSDSLTLVSSEYNPESSGTLLLYDCDLGGTYLYHRSGSVYGGGSGQFEDCRMSGVSLDEVINGSFSHVPTLIKYVYNPGWSDQTSYRELSRTQADGRTRRLDGTLDDRSGPLGHESWTDLNYTAQAFEGQTVINEANSRSTVGAETGGPDALPWQRTFKSDFTVQSPVTGNKSITVQTVELFSTPYANTCYLAGQLIATAIDGSQLILDADNGDPLSFDMDVISTDGDFSETVPWTTATALGILADTNRDDSELPLLTSPEGSGDVGNPCGQQG